jgi:hypothetical protein
LVPDLLHEKPKMMLNHGRKPMKTGLKVALLVTIVAVGTLLGSPAAWAASCDLSPTVGAWTQCEQGDKQYTKISTTLPGAVAFGVGISLPQHIVALGSATAVSLPVGIFNLHYTIQILDPLFTFVDASLDTTVPGSSGAVTVIKVIRDASNNILATLTSTAGNPDGPDPIGSGLHFVDVTEAFTVGPGGILTSATNTYTQTQTLVPAPASLILLGLGLTGAALASRKRNR